METATNHSPGVAGGTDTPAPPPDLQRLADQLAAKHAAGPPGAARGADAPRNKGGRRSTEEEVSAYLDRHNLRAVPADALGDPGGDPAGLPGGELSDRPLALISPEFVRMVAKTALDGLQNMRCRQVYQAVVKLSADVNLAKEVASEATAPAGCIDVMTLCAEEIARKYSLLSSYSPEACLLIAGAAWFIKDRALAKKLDQLRALKVKQEAKPEGKPPAA